MPFSKWERLVAYVRRLSSSRVYMYSAEPVVGGRRWTAREGAMELRSVVEPTGGPLLSF